MKRDMHPGDRVCVTLGGVTHEFDRTQTKISVDDTRTRDGERSRYVTIIIALDGEFPERPPRQAAS